MEYNILVLFIFSTIPSSPLEAHNVNPTNLSNRPLEKAKSNLNFFLTPIRVWKCIVENSHPSLLSILSKSNFSFVPPNTSRFELNLLVKVLQNKNITMFISNDNSL